MKRIILLLLLTGTILVTHSSAEEDCGSEKYSNKTELILRGGYKSRNFNYPISSGYLLGLALKYPTNNYFSLLPEFNYWRGYNENGSGFNTFEIAANYSYSGAIGQSRFSVFAGPSLILNAEYPFTINLGAKASTKISKITSVGIDIRYQSIGIFSPLAGYDSLLTGLELIISFK